MENKCSLENISPVDGRYIEKTKRLSSYFSEYALFRYRVMIEVEYFIALCKIPLKQLGNIDPRKIDKLRSFYRGFELKDAIHIKEIESTTNHDVKAVEYYLAEKFSEIGLQEYVQFLHFGLTSQDINNTAFPLCLNDALNEQFKPMLKKILKSLKSLSEKWKDVSMLARTHGQAASPTRMGKEILVFAERLKIQLENLSSVHLTAKFGGATGNFNAHHVAYPDVDWVKFSNDFLNSFGLERQQVTTQIEHYDQLAALFHAICRINTILLDFCRDIWMYVSYGYFSQKISETEVGSSTMPHKINPIDFENAEGNLGVANALLLHMASKLPVSRLQRDLTDSTVMRNTGTTIAYSMIAYQSILKGLNKLVINEIKIAEDLEDNWAVVAEAIQTILRREGYSDAYESLKKLTRTGCEITMVMIHEFIENLQVSNDVKKEMQSITPQNYTGI